MTTRSTLLHHGGRKNRLQKHSSENLWVASQRRFCPVLLIQSTKMPFAVTGGSFAKSESGDPVGSLYRDLTDSLRVRTHTSKSADAMKNRISRLSEENHELSTDRADSKGGQFVMVLPEL